MCPLPRQFERLAVDSPRWEWQKRGMPESDTAFGIALICVVAIAAVILIAWVVFPLVVFNRLKRMDEKLAALNAIEKNTREVAKFFNERDVKIE
jgi:flagellar biosynthesis/type III secretory pathway M-ring protein FliF/YscJ